MFSLAIVLCELEVSQVLCYQICDAVATLLEDTGAELELEGSGTKEFVWVACAGPLVS